MGTENKSYGSVGGAHNLKRFAQATKQLLSPDRNSHCLNLQQIYHHYGHVLIMHRISVFSFHSPVSAL